MTKELQWVSDEIFSFDEAKGILRQWGRWLHMTGSLTGTSGVSRYRERLGEPARGLVLMPDNETAERADRVLCRIKQQDREVFRVLYLLYYCELSQYEAGQEIGKSETVVKRLHRVGLTAFASYWDAGYGKVIPVRHCHG